MQILELVLYSRIGKKRSVKFRPRTLNIVTGASSTGKSALIEIIEYCVGRPDCTVPEGVIRNTVSWYGLRLQFPNEQIFIARRNPPHGQRSTSEAFILQGDEVPSPNVPPVEPNTTSEAVAESLTQRLNISANIHIPTEDSTRAPLTANIRHAIIFCLQNQNEIANKSKLFHRQDDHWIFQAIKDTLPYFLGAVQENYLALRQDLLIAKRELAKMEKKLADAAAIQGEDESKAYTLLMELKDADVISPEETPRNLEEYITLFKRYSEWVPRAADIQGSTAISDVENEIVLLRTKLHRITHELKSAEQFAAEAEGFTTQLRHQESRLETINLFDVQIHEADVCPVCSQKLKKPVPKVSSMKKSLEKIRENLQSTTREEPRLREYMDGLKRLISDTKSELRAKSATLESLIRQNQVTERERNLSLKQSRAVGRMTYWLENTSLSSSITNLKQEVETGRKKVAEIERKVDEEYIADRFQSAMNRIGVRISEWSKLLELEHSENPARLDEKNLTIIADSKEGPIPLYKMGSGENWLGYHLLVHLALHEYFIDQNRPVPHFLFLDQPSQVYFPPDDEGKLPSSLKALKLRDREKVLRMYKFILDVINGLKGQFQVIVTDHADLKEKFFKSHIIENWHTAEKLVPENWIQDVQPPH